MSYIVYVIFSEQDKIISRKQMQWIVIFFLQNIPVWWECIETMTLNFQEKNIYCTIKLKLSAWVPVLWKCVPMLDELWEFHVILLL